MSLYVHKALERNHRSPTAWSIVSSKTWRPPFDNLAVNAKRDERNSICPGKSDELFKNCWLNNWVREYSLKDHYFQCQIQPFGYFVLSLLVASSYQVGRLGNLNSYYITTYHPSSEFLINASVQKASLFCDVFARTSFRGTLATTPFRIFVFPAAVLKL